jgi:glycosyltransferase involved in cell wall biosynthesis
VHLGINLPEVVDKERISISDKVRKREKLVFFQASNFVEKKGHEFTINAFEMFLRIYPNAELIFEGSGELLLPIKELVKNLDIEPKVRFLGHLSSESVLDFMANADIFLHHSITASNGDQESIPTVIMEAMSCGLPVISTFHSGIPELIQSGTDGILVEERNVDKYYEAMVGLLADDGLITLNAKNKVNKYFSLPKNLSTIVDFTLN